MHVWRILFKFDKMIRCVSSSNQEYKVTGVVNGPWPNALSCCLVYTLVTNIQSRCPSAQGITRAAYVQHKFYPPFFFLEFMSESRISRRTPKYTLVTFLSPRSVCNATRVDRLLRIHHDTWSTWKHGKMTVRGALECHSVVPRFCHRWSTLVYNVKAHGLCNIHTECT